VVSICRKVWKFPASVAPVFELRELLEELVDEGRGVVPEVTGVATFVVVVISVSLHSDVYAAG
jgi:hypothetical protein